MVKNFNLSNNTGKVNMNTSFKTLKSRKKFFVITADYKIIVNANNNNLFFNIINSNNMVISDDT